MKNKIAVVCTNYGSIKDGIGDYTKKLIAHFDESKYIVDIYSEEVIKKNKINLYFSFKMIKQLKKLYINSLKYDFIIIEYPFNEWNPLIIYYIKKIYKKNKQIILDLHEYSRVNQLRRLVINKLVDNSEYLILTKGEEFITNKKRYYRLVPSNIENYFGLLKNTDNNFVYFGLINKNKRVIEVLEAWKEIKNLKKVKGLNEFYFVSSSDLNGLKERYSNVKFYNSLYEREVSEIFYKCNFAFFPIEPNISEKNATFKTAMIHGTIPIGKFDDMILAEYPVLKKFHLNSYSKAEIASKLIEVSKMSQEDIFTIRKTLYFLSEKYSFESIKEIYVKIFSGGNE